MENVTITIQEKKPYSGEAKKHPEGDFYCDDVKYTCWDRILFETFNIGDLVRIDYTEKKNEYNGRTFTNRNISKMVYATPEIAKALVEDAIKANTNHQGYPNSELHAGNVTIKGTIYEVILRVVGNE